MDRRSRLVAIFKVLLPLTALAILATLFLLSSSDDPVATIPFSEQEVSERLRTQQVTAPYFSGTTAKGEEILLTAGAATPGAPGEPARATDLDARLTLSGGGQITLRSDEGALDMTDDVATFIGDVWIATTTGLTLRTELLNAALDSIEGNAPGTVTGSGPMGDFTAGQMDITSESDDGPVHIVFKNGVKLIYDPQKADK